VYSDDLKDATEFRKGRSACEEDGIAPLILGVRLQALPGPLGEPLELVVVLVVVAEVVSQLATHDQFLKVGLVARLGLGLVLQEQVEDDR
jgi:hypothetical protein